MKIEITVEAPLKKEPPFWVLEGVKVQRSDPPSSDSYSTAVQRQDPHLTVRDVIHPPVT